MMSERCVGRLLPSLQQCGMTSRFGTSSYSDLGSRAAITALKPGARPDQVNIYRIPELAFVCSCSSDFSFLLAVRMGSKSRIVLSRFADPDPKLFDPV